VSAVHHGWLPSPQTTLILACGCRIRVYEKPRPGTRLACKSNQGHGYRLQWVSATDERGVTVVNQEV
jgi:hypothetical protein